MKFADKLKKLKTKFLLTDYPLRFVNDFIRKFQYKTGVQF